MSELISPRCERCHMLLSFEELADECPFCGAIEASSARGWHRIEIKIDATAEVAEAIHQAIYEMLEVSAIGDDFYLGMTPVVPTTP